MRHHVASLLAALPPLASRFAEVESLPWEATPRQPGVAMRTLLVDRDTDLPTMLIRVVPGARLPGHEHVLVEQTHVVGWSNSPAIRRR